MPKDLIDDASRMTARKGLELIADYIDKKIIGVTFCVFGARAVGKTELIRAVRGDNVLLNPGQGPTQPGGTRIGSFDPGILGRDAHRARKVFDVSGERTAWERDWCDIYTRVCPRGILFVADHGRVEEHRQALGFLIDMLQTNDPFRLFRRRRPYPRARRRLRALFLVFNKCDIWQGTTCRDDLLAPFAPEIQRIERLIHRQLPRVQYYVRSCSAKYGDGVREMWKDFVEVMKR